MDIWQGLQILKRRRGTLLVSSFLALAAILASTQLISVQYASSARLLVKPPQRLLTLSSAAGAGQASDWLIQPGVLMEVFSSQDFLERAVRTGASKESWQTLRQHLDVQPAGGKSGAGNILRVSVTSEDPQEAFRICDRVIAEFLRYLPEVAAREQTGNRVFLEHLVKEASARLQQAEREALAWRRKHPMVEAASTGTNFVGGLTDLERQEAEAQQQVLAQQGRLRQVRAGEVPVGVLQAGGGVLSDLEQQLTKERMKLTHLEQVYLPGTASVVDQRRIIDRTRALLDEERARSLRALEAERQAQLAEAEGRLTAVRESITRMRQARRASQDNLEYAQLQRQIATANRNHDELLGQLYAARIAEQSARREGALALIEKPQPAVPVRAFPVRDWRRILPLAIPLALGFGLLVAFSVEQFRTSMRMRPRIEEAIGLPVLGSIPHLPREFARGWDRVLAEAGAPPPSPLSRAIDAPPAA